MNIIPRQTIQAAIAKARADMPGQPDDLVFERVAADVGADADTVRAVATEAEAHQ